MIAQNGEEIIIKRSLHLMTNRTSSSIPEYAGLVPKRTVAFSETPHRAISPTTRSCTTHR